MTGAGKSTFSRMLSTKTDLPALRLALHSWRSGWVRVPTGEFLQKQRSLLAGEKWIVDGNDVDNDLLFEPADTFVIITPWWMCAWRAFISGLQRPPGAHLPEGCDESALQRIGGEWGIVWRNWPRRNSVPERDIAIAAPSRRFTF